MNEESFEERDWRWRVFDSLSFPTLILKPERVIVTANQKFFDKFGVQMKDIVGKTCHEIFYQSIVVVSRFEHNRLSEIRIYPIELGHTNRFADRGIPRLAPPLEAKVILERLQKLSEPYGTAIVIEQNNVGMIRLQSSAPVIR